MLTVGAIKAALSVIFVIMYTYGAELFPSNIRGTTNGIAFNFGRGISIISAYLITMSVETFHTNAIVGCAAVCLLSLPFLGFMPETVGRKIE